MWRCGGLYASIFLLALEVCPRTVAHDGSAQSLGCVVAPFSLPDSAGQAYTLPDPAQSPLVVVAFVGTECPLVGLYLPRLAEMAGRYRGKGVAFVGIDSNLQDSPADVATLAKRHELPFPILLDPGAKIADRFAAARTPEVFVLDRERAIRYRGRIDDQFGIGYQRPRPTRADLERALESLLAGQPVEIPATLAVGCLIGRPPSSAAGGTSLPAPAAPAAPAAPGATPTWSGEVRPIFFRRCQSCHQPGGIAPFALTAYQEVLGWVPTIQEVVEARRMPPWHAEGPIGEFSNDCRLTETELGTLHAWFRGGAPPGDLALEAVPLEKASQARPEPDLVIPMADQPVHVPALGEATIHRFTVDPGFTEGKWLRFPECLPGNRRVIHHFAVFAVHPADDRQMHWSRRLIDIVAGYSPGMEGQAFPDGMCKYIPAGAHLVFELHYTPCGTPETDISSLALTFERVENVTHLVKVLINATSDFAIPPGDPDYVIDNAIVTDRDYLLVTMHAHAHVRCRSFLFEAIPPGQSARRLLSLPNYDMNWQQLYYLREPIPLPMGTALRVVARYDNSAANPRNPDPGATVVDGDVDVLGNEMMNAFFFVAEERPKRLPIARYRSSFALVPHGLLFVGSFACFSYGGIRVWRRRQRERSA